MMSPPPRAPKPSGLGSMPRASSAAYRSGGASIDSAEAANGRSGDAGVSRARTHDEREGADARRVGAGGRRWCRWVQAGLETGDGSAAAHHAKRDGTPPGDVRREAVGALRAAVDRHVMAVVNAARQGRNIFLSFALQGVRMSLSASARGANGISSPASATSGSCSNGIPASGMLIYALHTDACAKTYIRPIEPAIARCASLPAVIAP